LQLLAAAQQQGGDAAGLQATMQKLVLYYPSPNYWASLIGNLQRRSGFSDRLALDVQRLQRAVHTLDTADGYTELAELALAADLPGEARSVLEEGYARHLLGTGPGAARQARLKALADKNFEDDRQRLDQSVAAAGDADPNRVEELGEQYLSLGEIDKGSVLVEQSLRKGQLRHADDARLHLGLAYLNAGQPAKAVQIFRTVGGTDGAADLAKLWILHTGNA
jgi:tetratricopeptide (TPR) repeat protein